MDLDWHIETNFERQIPHPADEWLEWDRAEVEYHKRQKELRPEKRDDHSKQEEVYLFQSFIIKLLERKQCEDT
tara:strand:+ start:2027 stop:2245 length:219 start_codon:yes stop_codon:yes gene_type:complete